MKTRSFSLLTASMALVAAAGTTGGFPPAGAAANSPALPELRMTFFQTPSGNIRCGMFKASGRWSMRCDIYDHAWVAPPRRTPCGYGDYGSSVGMGRKGSPRFLCVSDAMDGGRTLKYGTTIKYGPYFCRSRPKGLKCYNARGHGWFLSRETYRLF